MKKQSTPGKNPSKQSSLKSRFFAGVYGPILLFLTLGTIINLTVAWGCVLLSPRIMPAIWDPPLPSHYQKLDTRYRPAKYPVYDDGVRAWSSFGYEKYRVSSFNYMRLPGDELVIGYTTFYSKSGWPFISHWKFVATEVEEVASGVWMVKKNGLPTICFGCNISFPHPFRRKNWGYISLPWYPLFPGWLGNTTLYAFILSLPWLYRMLRRHRRIRRGRCGQCGYLVAPNIGVPGASPHCPECGTQIPQFPNADS